MGLRVGGAEQSVLDRVEHRYYVFFATGVSATPVYEACEVSFEGVHWSVGCAALVDLTACVCDRFVVYASAVGGVVRGEFLDGHAGLRWT